MPWVVPPGATGFPTGPAATRFPAAAAAGDPADLRAFATVCHQAARMAGGRVGAVTPAGTTPNFHTVEIVRPASDADPADPPIDRRGARDREAAAVGGLDDPVAAEVTVAVLRHVVLPLVAYARPRPDGDMTLVSPTLRSSQRPPARCRICGS